jgi:hypothetical protein
MKTTRSVSTWMSGMSILFLMPQSIRAHAQNGSDPDYDDPLEQSSTDATRSGSDGSMGNKTRVLIIILSVVVLVSRA